MHDHHDCLSGFDWDCDETEQKRLAALAADVHDRLDSLAPDERLVIMALHGITGGDPLTRSEIAQLLDTTVETVHRLERSGLEQLHASGTRADMACGPNPPTTTAHASDGRAASSCSTGTPVDRGDESRGESERREAIRALLTAKVGVEGRALDFR